MLFKRRLKKPFSHHLKNFFWPQMGWKRSCTYIKHRAIRLNASNYAVAAGLAFGCSISFVPTLGFHILQCMLLCFLFRANYLASILGTIFGNPWTFPFLFFISYKVGIFFIEIMGLSLPLGSQEFDITLSTIKEAPWAVLKPLLIGGYATALLTFPVFYLGFYVMVRSARTARKKLIHTKGRKV
ncbi:MAG: DUF2062 domain-containing protein [Pseudomonadota bacterium]